MYKRMVGEEAIQQEQWELMKIRRRKEWKVKKNSIDKKGGS